MCLLFFIEKKELKKTKKKGENNANLCKYEYYFI